MLGHVFRESVWLLSVMFKLARLYSCICWTDIGRFAVNECTFILMQMLSTHNASDTFMDAEIYIYYLSLFLATVLFSDYPFFRKLLAW